MAILALNTALHTPGAKKMTKDGFLQHCVHISTPSTFLEKIYQRISKFEIKLNSEDSLFDTAEMQGYLIKEGGSVKTWKKRWFVLYDRSLYYFASPGVNSPIFICIYFYEGFEANWNYSSRGSFNQSGRIA